MMERGTWNRWHGVGLGLITAVGLLFILYYRQTLLATTGGVWGAPLDDTWIHMQFARNLSQGQGFSYNPGEPTPGSTSPLWTLLLAAVALFTDRLLIPAAVLSALFLLVSTWLTYGFTWSLTRSWWAAVGAGMAVATTGRMLWAGLAGMETTLFAALSLAAVWAYTRGGLRPWTALLMALASQVRPEGHALFALAVADTSWQAWSNWRQNSPTAAWWPALRPSIMALITAVVLYGLIAAPYALFSLATTGQPLANTFYAKAGSQHFFSWRALREMMGYHWQDNPISLLLLPVGVWFVWRPSRLTAVWLLGLWLLTPIVVDLIWHHGRYTLPLIPLQMVVASVGAYAVVQKMGLWRPRLQSFWPMLMLVLFLGGGLWRGPTWATMLANNAQEILEVDVAIAEWLRANTPPEALIAVDDIGAIGYLSERRLFDLNGLISPEMWPLIRSGLRGRPFNEESARFLSTTVRPDYLVVFPEWHWELATNPIIMEEVALFRATTKTIIGEQRAVIYRVRYWPYVETAAPQTPTSAVYGESISLLGYELTAEANPTLTLYWQSVQPVAESYDVFIHIVDETGQIVAQADTAPVATLAPTNRWQVGDIIRDEHTFTRPPDLPTGMYTIRVGFFLRETGQRLTAVGPQAEGDVITIASFSW